MREIAIYGAGGFGREVALMIEQINAQNAQPWVVSGYYDDNKQKGSVVDGRPVLGNMDDLNQVRSPLAVVVAIAEPVVRRRVRENIKNPNITFPPIFHPSAQLGDLKRNHFEEGVIITGGNFLTTGIRIQAFAIINLCCTIGHDVLLGEFSTVMPGCSVSGAVNIGSTVLIGSGARILPGISVGDQSKVGAGAVVIEDVPVEVTVVGVPARVARKDQEV